MNGTRTGRRWPAVPEALGAALAGAAAAGLLLACGPGAPPTTAPAGTPGAAGTPAAAAGFPLTLNNCGFTATYPAPPKRAVTLNQNATEVMLALDLGGTMVGTAYLDDAILPQYQAAYSKIPVLAAEYPSKEVFLAANPDFAFAGFKSAFSDEGVGSRESLKALNIASYLNGADCKAANVKMTMQYVYDDILNVGRISGVEPRAKEYVGGMTKQVEEVTTKVKGVSPVVKVFWYDSGEQAPLAGACCGVPGMAVELAGAKNIFDDVEGQWKAVNWETVIARNPDVIVLTEAEWSTAKQKEAYLLGNPALAGITAVQQKRFVVVPFTSTSPGVRNPTLIQQVAAGVYPDRFK